ncbi:DMT family transporter [Streptomyces parvulus]|uniref:DMT family transporter n=1 Tax=Streptomyces parvulus TaxID=146923 RepID=A0A369UZT4_9ACTN|nr:DMT family transporter [Streptomyces parvulus]RDD85298.1 DMT family transporter [Streptomyces parvulus]
MDMKFKVDLKSASALTVTVVAVSATAPLTASATASPLAMAFWRNFLGFCVLAPLLLLLRRREVTRVLRRERGLLRRGQWRPLVFSFLAALSLALHFAAFMTSTRLTSVAMSTALVATQPVWQALIAAGQGVKAARGTWLGLALAVVGTIAATSIDIQAGGTALLGDLLALAGAVAQAGYTALGEKARADVSTPLYSAFTALICGLALLAVCLLADIPLTGYDKDTQLALIGLLILPQILGLGALNFVLGRVPATLISVLLLLETPVAALVAWWLMGQGIDPKTAPGLLLIIVGVTVVLTSGGRERPEPRTGRHRKSSRTRRGRSTHAADPALAGGHLPKQREPSLGQPADWYTEPHWATADLSYHGAGAFDTLRLRKITPNPDGPRTALSPPAEPTGRNTSC